MVNDLIFKPAKKDNIVNREFLTKLIRLDISSKEKFQSTKKHLSEYLALKKTVSSGKIYHNLEQQNQEVIKLSHLIDKENFKIKEVEEKNIRKFLQKQKLESNIDFTSTKNFIQVGLNMILVEEPIRSLWNTGNGTIYMPVKENLENQFEIKAISIPPVEIRVNVSDKQVLHHNLDTLQTKLLRFTIGKDLITDTIVKLDISTDKYWLPDVIIQDAQSIPLGVGIKSITNITS